MWCEVERRTGTYAKLVPCAATKDRISEIVNILNLENPVSVHDLHVTVIYSRKECAEIKDINVCLPTTAHGEAFDIFPNHDGSKCLVLKLESEAMHSLHQTIRDEHGGTHDYPSYSPHLTLSYDFASDMPNHTILDYFKDLHFDQYVVEPLDLNWIKS
jgi:hypothetical protein